jgi:hypothetical protein
MLNETGMRSLARAAHAINRAIYPNLPFDPLKDFTLITVLRVKVQAAYLGYAPEL